VSHGADVNIANTDGTRPLHYFARKRLQPETLESNARVQPPPQIAQDFIFLIIAHVHICIVQALDVMLTAGADLNVRNVNDETPLHGCVMKGNLATLELLINRSADINAVNKCVALYLALRLVCDEVHSRTEYASTESATTYSTMRCCARSWT